jgi:MFS family permease
VVVGLVAVVVLSLGTDQVLHILEVYPPWGKPMYESGLLGLALAYRCAYNVVGGYLAARFAPRNPRRHALILGVIGTALGLVGAIATIPMHLGPAWYPLSLVVTALPFTWAGGALYRVRTSEPMY